jgi:hypothetical protein
MLNTILASVATLVWGVAYGWFFASDVRRWWRGRELRRARAAAEREQARRAYAAWVRDIPPPRPHAPIMPQLLTRPASGVQSGVVIPFPHPASPRR